MTRRTCSIPLSVGNQSCRFSDAEHLLIEVKERINLFDCRQSSQLDVVDYCENALNLVHAESHRLGRCAQTQASDRPWWRARVFGTSLFEQIVLYSLAGHNEWTKNFQVTVEKRPCVSVTNGGAFLKGTFDCGLSGVDITVQALGSNVSLAICELVAFGRPGGCGQYLRDMSYPCRGRLQSHIGYRKQPYESSLHCQWTVGGAADQTVLLTFPEFRTAGLNDHLAVYDGIGTGGTKLAMFYGSGQHKPKYPWMTAHGVSNFVRGRQAHLTLVFVTEKSPAGAGNRTVGSHLGFTVEFLLTHNDYSYEYQSDLTPICEERVFLNILNGYCLNRDFVHPIITHGSPDGDEMYKQMQQNFLRQQSRTRSEDGSAAAASRSKRSLYQMALRDFHCNSGESIEELPFFMQNCCCRPCSVKFLIGLCMQHYATLGGDACSLRVTRLV